MRPDRLTLSVVKNHGVVHRSRAVKLVPLNDRTDLHTATLGSPAAGR
jgi:hypothetical protein